jgi:hypothetical protein
VSALELFNLLTGSGIFTGGIAAATWVLRTERRIMRLEIEAKLA